MQTANKHNWMIWAIIALAIMNISTLATVFYHQYQSGKVDSPIVQSLYPSDNNAAKFSGKYFRDKLSFDNVQMERFREINPTFRQQARGINIELDSMRGQMLDEMAAATSDTSRLNALSDSIGSLHATLKQITFRYYLDLKKICNPQQKKILEQMFSEMFTNDASMGFPGKGGPGWQRGKQMNNN